MKNIRYITMLAVAIGPALLTVLWHTTYMNSREDRAPTIIESKESPTRSPAFNDVAGAFPSAMPSDTEKGSKASQSGNVDTTSPLLVQCEKGCVDVLELLRQSVDLSDSQLEHALGFSDELAAFLKSNFAAQRELIKVAIQSSGNTRRLIIAAFTQLAPNIQWQLGRALIESSGRVKRLDGVQLLASTSVMNGSLIPYFEHLYASESDEHVREAIVRAFDRQDMFQGNSAALNFLTTVIHSDTSSAVRGDALLAGVRLSDDAHFAVNNSIAAVRSEAGDYQVSGARALSEFISLYTMNGHAISSQHKSDMDQLMVEVMTAEFDTMPEQARIELDNLYARFF